MKTDRILLIAIVLLFHPPRSAHAQPLQVLQARDVPAAIGDSATGSRNPRASLPGPNRAGIAGRRTCSVPPCLSVVLEPVQDSPPTIKRGRYAWWGLAIGAGLGWFLSSEACRREDCYGTGFSLVIVGGAVGLIVGLLLSPG